MPTPDDLDDTTHTGAPGPQIQGSGDAAEPVARLVGIIGLPIAISDLPAKIAALEAVHGPGLMVKNHGSEWLLSTPGRTCWCVSCAAADAAVFEEATGRMMPRLFIVCPDCGNKRCSRAAHHDQDCSGSNEPGQPGSGHA